MCKNTENEEQYSNQLRAVMPHTPRNFLWHTGWQKFVSFNQEFSFYNDPAVQNMFPPLRFFSDARIFGNFMYVLFPSLEEKS